MVLDSHMIREHNHIWIAHLDRQSCGIQCSAISVSFSCPPSALIVCSFNSSLENRESSLNLILLEMTRLRPQCILREAGNCEKQESCIYVQQQVFSDRCVWCQCPGYYQSDRGARSAGGECQEWHHGRAGRNQGLKAGSCNECLFFSHAVQLLCRISLHAEFHSMFHQIEILR